MSAAFDRHRWRREIGGVRGAPMLSRREPFLGLTLRLLCQDATFRGLLEFALIAAVVLTFIHRPAVDALLPSFKNFPLLTSHGSSPVPPATPIPAPMFQAVPAVQSPVAPAARVAQAATVAQAAPAPQSLAAAVSDGKVTLRDLVLSARGYLFPRMVGPGFIKIDGKQFASSTPDTRAKLTQAIDLYKQHHPDQAAALLEKVDPADPNVMLVRGISLATEPDSANVTAGVRLMETAIARGQRQASGVLGLLLLSGNGFNTDMSRGMRLLQQAADAGDISAASILGVVLYNGAYDKVDPAGSTRYLQMASTGGDGDATLRLAYFAYLRPVTADSDAEAERLVRSAADQDSMTAETLLGVYEKVQFLKGWIVDGNSVVRLLDKAVQHGSMTAEWHLGDLYARSPQAAWRDLEKAAHYFRRCAIFKEYACLSSYGEMLEKGIGVARDPVTAYALYAMVPAGSMPARMAALEKTMTESERAAADKLTMAGRTNQILWVFALAGPEKDKNGCLQIGNMLKCMNPDGTVRSTPATGTPLFNAAETTTLKAQETGGTK